MNINSNESSLLDVNAASIDNEYKEGDVEETKFSLKYFLVIFLLIVVNIAGSFIYDNPSALQGKKLRLKNSNYERTFFKKLNKRCDDRIVASSYLQHNIVFLQLV